jgi:periplasmic divalent cation tolerance protein
MSDDEVCEVIITADNADWLADFTRSLVEDRLAACGQNISYIRSIYRWEGQVQDEPEARVALHTRTSLVPAIVDRANRDHPYKVPCVIALPIAGGNPDYFDWVRTETRSAKSVQTQ